MLKPPLVSQQLVPKRTCTVSIDLVASMHYSRTFNAWRISPSSEIELEHLLEAVRHKYVGRTIFEQTAFTDWLWSHMKVAIATYNREALRCPAGCKARTEFEPIRMAELSLSIKLV